MPANTPVLGFPYPVPGDTVDVPRDAKALADKCDTIASMKIAEVVTAGGQTTIDFNAIPQNFRHLRLIGMVRSQRAAVQNSALRMTFNGVVANYTTRILVATGAAPTSGVQAATPHIYLGQMPAAAAFAAAASAFEILIPAYTLATPLKAALSRLHLSDNAVLELYETVGTNSIGAINSIRLVDETGAAFVNGMVVTLYGEA